LLLLPLRLLLLQLLTPKLLLLLLLLLRRSAVREHLIQTHIRTLLSKS